MLILQILLIYTGLKRFPTACYQTTCCQTKGVGIVKVAFFPGCMVDMFYPHVGMSAVKVLEKLGCEVELPKEPVCCGQPFSNSGYAKEARPLMKSVVKGYENYDVIVSLTGSCAYAVKNDAKWILKDDDKALSSWEKVSSRIFEFTDFLVNALDRSDFGRLDASVTYHKSCHVTRLLGVKEAPLQLLESIDGLKYVEMKAADRCCGFGGTFCLKEPEIAERIAREKVDLALATGTDYLCGADQACLMNIDGTLQRMKNARETDSNMQVVHIAQILAMALEA